MKINQFIKFTLCAIVVVYLFFAWNWLTVQAQNNTFLYPPFFGTEAVTSIFDHEYPIYHSEHDLGIPNISTTVVHYNSPNRVNLSYSGHNGIDYSLNYEYVLASANGTVSYAGWANPGNHRAGYGLQVRISHQHNNINYRTLYGHLSSISVVTNEIITRTNETDIDNALIGISGDTGNSSGGHLHFTAQKSVRFDNDDGTFEYEWVDVNPYGWEGEGVDPWANAELAIGEGIRGTASVDLWATRPSVGADEEFPNGAVVQIPSELESRFIPALHATGAIVVDDTDEDRFTTTGNWQTVSCTADNCFNLQYQTSTIAGTTATWQPEATELLNMEYDLYAYIPTLTYTQEMTPTKIAAFEIYHNGRIDWAGLNQQTVVENIGQHWAYLGRYTFNGHGLEYVRLVSDIASNETYVAVDALAFVPAEAIYTAEFPIITSSDDAGYGFSSCLSFAPTNYATDSANLMIGACVEEQYFAGFRFQNITLPSQAQLTQATLKFYSGDESTDETALLIYGDNTPNSATFSINSQPAHRPATVIRKNWFLDYTDLWLLSNGPYYTPDIQEIVEEIMVLPGWQMGNPMTFIIAPHPSFPSGVREIRSWDTDVINHSHPPTLVVWYTLGETLPPPPPPPTPTPTPTVLPTPTATPAVRPPAPTNLQANSGPFGQGILLTWNYSLTGHTYAVYRDRTSFVPIGKSSRVASSLSSKSYYDPEGTLSSGPGGVFTNYYYVVTSANKEVESLPSNVAPAGCGNDC